MCCIRCRVTAAGRGWLRAGASQSLYVCTARAAARASTKGAARSPSSQRADSRDRRQYISHTRFTQAQAWRTRCVARAWVPRDRPRHRESPSRSSLDTLTGRTQGGDGLQRLQRRRGARAVEARRCARAPLLPRGARAPRAHAHGVGPGARGAQVSAHELGRQLAGDSPGAPRVAAGCGRSAGPSMRPLPLLPTPACSPHAPHPRMRSHASPHTRPGINSYDMSLEKHTVVVFPPQTHTHPP